MHCDKEYKVEADLGPLLIAFRETILFEGRRIDVAFNRRILGNEYDLKLSLSVEPNSEPSSPSTLIVSKDSADAENVDGLKHHHLRELRRGFENAVSRGPVLGFPVLGATFIIHGAEMGSRSTPPTLWSSMISEAVEKVLETCDVRLLEPVMRLEVTAEENSVLGSVRQDLLKKRAEFLEDESGPETLVALAPLTELRGYSKRLRTMTSGQAFFGMELSHYALMEKHEQKKAVEIATGLSRL